MGVGENTLTNLRSTFCCCRRLCGHHHEYVDYPEGDIKEEGEIRAMPVFYGVGWTAI